MSEADFGNDLIDMARSVSDFHTRWGIDRQGRSDTLPFQWLSARSRLIAEENIEFETADDWDAMAEEAADVLFVAIGTLDLLPDQLVARAMRRVTAKNDAKTGATHYVHPKTGKVTRRPEPG